MQEKLLQLLRLRGAEKIEDSVNVLTTKEIASIFPGDSGISLAIENVYKISRLVILSGGDRLTISQTLDNFETNISSLMVLEIVRPSPKFPNKFNNFIHKVIQALVS